MSTVLVVDDQERIREMLCRMLAAEGHRTVRAADGAEALAVLADEDVDLAVLDLVMPGAHGLDVLATLRAQASTTPVIVLSAVEEVSARIQALDLGAVDFVGKPFNSAELLARVRRNLSERPSRDSGQRYIEAGGIRLDLNRRRATVRATEVALSEREFALLAHLMRRRGDVCRRDELLHDVWGMDFDPGSNVVEVCVGRLRSKLFDPPIETVRSVGYCFVGD